MVKEKEMIINCTPHDISIMKDGITTVIPKSGIIPRVASAEFDTEQIDGFPCVENSYGKPAGIPDAVAGTYYIVSGMVFAATDRSDVVAPDTGSTAVRNRQGYIIAVTRLIRKAV